MHTYLGDLLTLCARMVANMNKQLGSSSSTSGDDGAENGTHGHSVPYEIAVQLLGQAAEAGIIDSAGFAGTISATASSAAGGVEGSTNTIAVFETVFLQAIDSEKGILLAIDRSVDAAVALAAALGGGKKGTAQAQQSISCVLLLHSPRLPVSMRMQVRVFCDWDIVEL